MGRKKALSSKNERISLRLTDAEQLQLQQKADSKGMYLSEYLLWAGLKRQGNVQIVGKLTEELRSYRNMQKDLHAHNLQHGALYKLILNEMLVAIKSIPVRIRNSG